MEIGDCVPEMVAIAPETETPRMAAMVRMLNVHLIQDPGGLLHGERMGLALQACLWAGMIVIRPVDCVILPFLVDERIVLVRQKGNNGAASYDHPLLSYAEHVLQKSLDPGAGIATLAKRPQGRIEGDDIVKALGRIIKLRDICQAGWYSHFLKTANNFRRIVVPVDITVDAAQ